MKTLNPTIRLVTASLFIAFTCVATMVIQIPTTATMGYIHIGDTFVILSGIFLGPLLGGLAAGIGSLLADALSGYVIFIIPTFLIKFASAFLCGYIFRILRNKKRTPDFLAFLTAAFIAEINVILGYFLNSIVLSLISNASASKETITAGISAGILGLFPNSIQAIVGIFLAATLFPLLIKIPTIGEFIPKKQSSLHKKKKY